MIIYIFNVFQGPSARILYGAMTSSLSHDSDNIPTLFPVRVLDVERVLVDKDSTS
jgi:hypothetical protein